MSQRSIIEINHDVMGMLGTPLNMLSERDKLVELLLQAIASGSDRSWEPLKRFGIHRVTQCHHSEDRKVVVGDREYPIP